MKQPIQQLTVTVAGIKVRQDSDGRFSPDEKAGVDVAASLSVMLEESLDAAMCGTTIENSVDGLRNIDRVSQMAAKAATLYAEYPAVASIFKSLAKSAHVNSAFLPLSVLSSSSESRASNYIGTKTYIIKNPRTGLIKIGKSKRVDERIHELGNASGVDLEVLCVIDSDVENPLHDRFSSLRIKGEWFSDPNGEIQRHAARLCREVAALEA